MKPRWATVLRERIAAIPLIDAELIPSSLRAVGMSAVMAAIGGLIVWSIYSGGVSRGMDHVLAYGTEIDLIPMSVAISESVYKIDLGYIGLAGVYGTLQNIVNRGSTKAGDAALLRNIRDRPVINEAIAAASSIPPQAVAYGYISDRRLMTTMYSDLGSVDYIKLSFWLFGRRIEALYNTFFVIVAASAIVFLATFPNSIAAQLLLLSSLFALRLELHTPIFVPDMPTFAGVRHSSTLSLIPALYLALLIVDRRTISWLSLAMAASQVALLILAITIRSTATWTVVFLVSLTVVCASYRWIAASHSERTLGLWLRHAAFWPVIALVAGLTIQGQLTKLKLHPVYFTDAALPYHPVWHAAYVGLQYSPELYGFPVRQDQMGSDLLAYDGALDYLRSVHFIGNETNLPALDALRAGGYFSPWNGGNPKYRLHDEIMRRVVFRIARNHPLKMIYLYAVKKPMAIWNICTDQVKRSERSFKGLVLAGGVVAGFLWIVFGSRKDLRTAVRLVAVGAGAVGLSTLPSLWAYPVSWSVADTLLLSFAMVVFVIGMSVYASYRMARAAVSAAAGFSQSAAGEIL